MSNPTNTVDQAFIRQYEAEVHQAYQRQGSILLHTVRRKTNVKGKSTTFQKIGKGSAGSKARNGDVPIMNPDHTPVEVTLVDKYAAQIIDKLDELKTNIDERAAVISSAAWAVGRVADEQILTALDATTTELGGGNVAFSKTRAQAAIQALYDLDVPFNDGMLYGTMPNKQWMQLMNITEFSSKDFVEEAVFPGGGRRFIPWLGVKWTPHNYLGSGAASGIANKIFIWHKSSLGHASGLDVASEFNYLPLKVAHLATSMCSMQAKLIDVNGAIEVSCD